MDPEESPTANILIDTREGSVLEGSIVGYTIQHNKPGIELWLEARCLSDLRRWIQEDTPGEMEGRDGPRPLLPVRAHRDRDQPEHPRLG